MNDAYRVPERGVDETEIERARVHEAGETRRKLIEEVQKTKRVRLEALGITPYVSVVAIAVVAMAIGAISYNNHLDAKAPKTPPACVEIVEVIDPSSAPRRCVGGHITSTVINNDGKVLWRCNCGEPATSTDAGAP